MNEYLPYITSVLCAGISGWISYSISRKAAKTDLQRLERQHILDIEKERELFSMEKEKLEIEHQHQKELLQKQLESSMGSSVINTLMSEAMKIPEVRQQISQGVRSGNKRKR